MPVMSLMSTPLPLKVAPSRTAQTAPAHSRTGPSNVALASLADGWARRPARAARMTIVPEACGKLVLAELLWLMQPHDDLFGAQEHAVHGR